MGALTYGEAQDGPEEYAEAGVRMPAAAGLLGAIFDRNPIATAVLDASGTILHANPSLCRLLGRRRGELIGSPLRAHATGDLLANGTAEQRLVHAHGHEIWCVASAVPLPEAGAGAQLVTLDDATSRHNTETMLLHAALHDSLTNLPNRRLLSDRLETALNRAERTSKTVAVLFVDLDDFKKVNDSLGHDVGDTVLVSIARNIISVLRTCDTVARLGGDEFVVLCEDVTSEGDISRLVGRLLEAIRRPVAVGDHLAQVNASVGVAIPTIGNETSDELVRMADLAMYRAKQHPGLDYVIADESLTEAGVPSTALVADLRRAIQGDELELYYQPVVRVDGQIIGLEALLRWNHSALGLLYPRDFLHVARSGELAGPLTDWVLRTAIAEAGTWRDPTLRVSINVWASEVAREGFADTVAELCTWAGVQARSVYLEMHESDLPAAGPGLAVELDQLRRMGVGLAIDDYGSGGSSLANLRRLPVDTLKIDRTFVAGVVDDPADAAIVEAVATAGRATGRHLVAAGVETHEQLGALRRLGYQSVQGFLTGSPMPREQLGRVLSHRRIDLDVPR